MEQQPYQEAAPTEHILDDLSYSVIQASGGKRFLNLILDGVASYLIFKFILVYPLTWLLTSIVEHGGSSDEIYALALSIGISWNIIYYAAFETLARGKTLGKLITGTVAVNEDGSRISFRSALLRSLIRYIPVEAFSALGSPCWPWHDRWTRTYVADERESTLPPGV